MLEGGFVESGVHDTEISVRELAYVASEENGLSGFELFNDCGLEVGDVSIDICNGVSTVPRLVRRILSREAYIARAGHPRCSRACRRYRASCTCYVGH